MADDEADILNDQAPDAAPLDAAPASEASPPPAPPAAFDFRGVLAEHGITLDEKADLKALTAELVSRARQAQQYEPVVAQYHQIAPKLHDFQKWEQEQARKAQQDREQPKEGPKEHWQKFWGKPSVDATTIDLMKKGIIVRDERSGRYIVDKAYASTISPSVAEQANAYMDWRQGKVTALVDDPREAMWEGLQPSIQELVAQQVQQAIGQYQSQNTAEQFVQRNFQTLFQHDQSGMPLQQNGQFLPTAEGQAFYQGMTWASQFTNDQTQLIRAGLDAIQNARTQAELADLRQRVAGQQAAAPPAKHSAKDEEFSSVVKRHAMHSPNGSGRPAMNGGRPDFNKILAEI